MSKRGKDKKKKRKAKSFASSSGGETTLLVGIQGKNVPVATCTLPAGDSSSHTTRNTACATRLPRSTTPSSAPVLSKITPTSPR